MSYQGATWNEPVKAGMQPPAAKSNIDDPNAPVMGVPLYEGAAPSGPLARFVVAGYKDLWAAVLFAIAVVTTIAFAIYGGSTTVAQNAPGNNSTEGLRVWAVAGGFASLGIALASLAAIRAAPSKFIIGSNVTIALLNIIVAIYALAQGQVWVGVILLLGGICGLVWLYLVRNRIPFAAAVLKTSIELIVTNWGTLITSFAALGVSAVFYVIWVLAAAPVNAAFNEGGTTNSSASWTYIAALALLLMLFWAAQVATNVVHVTSSGVVATWYFCGELGMPHSPTPASAKRALTTSFGSICFGSLVVAVIKLIYYLVQLAEQHARRDGDNAFLLCMLRCVIGCIEQLFEYFNVYAFTHVAIYGSSYVEAARQTWQLVKTCGWAAYFNDCLVWPVFTIVTLFGSVALGVVFGIVANSAIVGGLSFAICYMVMIIMLRPVYSGIVTQFVCIAECPDVMTTANPRYSQIMQDAIYQMGR